MVWLEKFKTPVIAGIVLLLVALLMANCTIDIGTEPGHVGDMSCDRLKLEYAEGQELTRLIDESGKSFLTFIEEDAADSLMGRFFLRMLIWHSGDGEAAEKVAADGHKMHMEALKKEIAARFS